MTSPWLQLCTEAEGCALDVSRSPMSLERLAKRARSGTPQASVTPAQRQLIRLSLGYCIETLHGRKHACEGLAAAARQVLAELPEQPRRERADIDG
jgi:hypothetical protein